MTADLLNAPTGPGRTDLIDILDGKPNSRVDARRDYRNSVSSNVIRFRHEGQLAVAVGADAATSTRVSAVLDLLDLHQQTLATQPGGGIDPDNVTLALGSPMTTRESLDAIGSLLSSMVAGPAVHVVGVGSDGTFERIGTRPFDAGDDSFYPGWLELLTGDGVGPPVLLVEVVRRVNRAALRAYPVLSSRGWWSLRLEGLEVGRFAEGLGWLNVGRDGVSNSRSEARRVWVNAVGTTTRTIVEPNSVSIDAAVARLRSFVSHWLETLKTPGAIARQNEHALESRILRGSVSVGSPDGRTLDLISTDPIVNWGSQFPTKWGRDGSARYLDALLREGTIPWALEIKVQGGGGIGQYYRHAFAQAVLYRHFIRYAKPLAPWFDSYGLDQNACVAAVVLPELTGTSAAWGSRLRRIGSLFDVALIYVSARDAALR